MVRNVLIKNENPNICDTGGERVNSCNDHKYEVYNTLYVAKISFKEPNLKKRIFHPLEVVYRGNQVAGNY